MEVKNPQVSKKRVVKKKNPITDLNTPSPEVSIPETPVHENPPQENVNTDMDQSYLDDILSIIPSSRIKNYISKEKLNKQFDLLISKLKENDTSLDLNSVLSEDMQSKLGSLIKQKEEKQEEIKINLLAIELLSKQKFKFSNQSFKVLSVFLDLMIEEITLNVMDKIIKNKKSIINLKYVFNELQDSPLYSIYSTLPTFISEKNQLSKSNAEIDEQQEEVLEEETQEDTSSHSINFEFYIRKICNKLKKNKEEFSKIKVSNTYQKFCSNLVLEFLDIVAPMTTIVLEVMTTKTITNIVFETIIKLQLYNNPHSLNIMNEIKSRLG